MSVSFPPKQIQKENNKKPEGITIVLPPGSHLRSTQGTQVLGPDGASIKTFRIQIDWEPNELLQATITVPVAELRNAGGLQGLLVGRPLIPRDDRFRRKLERKR